MVRTPTSSFPSQSSAASGPSLTPQIPPDVLGGQSAQYWEQRWVQSQHGVVLPLYSLKRGLNVDKQALIVWYRTLSSRNVPFHSTQMLFVDSTDKTGN